jgi:hypothetical protein
MNPVSSGDHATRGIRVASNRPHQTDILSAGIQPALVFDWTKGYTHCGSLATFGATFGTLQRAVAACINQSPENHPESIKITQDFVLSCSRQPLGCLSNRLDPTILAISSGTRKARDWQS